MVFINLLYLEHSPLVYPFEVITSDVGMCVCVCVCVRVCAHPQAIKNHSREMKPE